MVRPTSRKGCFRFVTILSLCLMGCGKPKIHIEMTRGFATIHVETLSDYPTTVDQITILREPSKDLMFKAVSVGKAQLQNFAVNIGPNGTTDLLHPSSGTYKVLFPSGDVFFLGAGTTYSVQVCEKQTCSSSQFRF